MKVHLVFHATLVSHIVINSLLEQRQESRESIVAKNGERSWYVNSILNFKRDRRFSPSLLKYYID